jgi:hypothetical protein
VLRHRVVQSQRLLCGGHVGPLLRLAGQLDGLPDEPRPGRPHTWTDEQVEAVIVRILEINPE